MGRSHIQNRKSRKYFKIVIGRPIAEKSLGKLGRRWEENLREA